MPGNMPYGGEKELRLQPMTMKERKMRGKTKQNPRMQWMNRCECVYVFLFSF